MNTKPHYQQTSLAGEFWTLFLRSNSHRSGLGITRALQRIAATDHPDDRESDMQGLDELFPKKKTVLCSDHGEDETCSHCDNPMDTLCSVDEAMSFCGDQDKDPLNNIAELLLSVKREDFQAAVSAYYAPVGEMPGKLNPPPVTDLPADELKKLAMAFFENIQSYLDETQMTVEQIPDGFEFNNVLELLSNMRQAAMDDVQDSVRKATLEAEKKLTGLFTRIKFMKHYQDVLDDITEYPIAGLWCTRKSLNKAVKIRNNKVTIDQKTMPDMDRIDPCYLWLSPDWRRDKHGRAVFTLKQVDCSTLEWCKRQTKKQVVLDAIDSIDTDAGGYRLNSGHLFTEDLVDDGTFDLLIGRGRYKKEDLEEYIDGLDKDCKWFNAEVWMLDQRIIYVDILPDWVDAIGGYGVYLTRFRNYGNSPWGLSLDEFLRPFALMFEGALKGINSSVKKTQGSIISIDLSVIENPDQQLSRDPKTGEVTMDLSGDTLIPFDSSQAVGSPNFKGKPVHIDKFPTDLPELRLTIATVLAYMELFSGIPSILSTGTPESSAIRTDQSYETAHRSAAKKPASILAKSRVSVLEPAVRFFYYAGIDLGFVQGMFLDAYPEIMLDERLSRWISHRRNMAATLNDIGPYAAQLPPERIGSLINMVAKVNGIEEELIPETNPIGNVTTTQTPGEI